MAYGLSKNCLQRVPKTFICDLYRLVPISVPELNKIMYRHRPIPTK